MSQEDQGKKISPVVSDAAVKEVIPAKPDKPTALSDEDLDKVAGGTASAVTLLRITNIRVNG